MGKSIECIHSRPVLQALTCLCVCSVPRPPLCRFVSLLPQAVHRTVNTVNQKESEVARSCPTLSDPMDCSLPGSSIHGIFQARVLEWGAIAFSTQAVHRTVDTVNQKESEVAQSCPTRSDPLDCIVHGILQARILEWGAFPFSRGSSQPRGQTQVSCIAGGFFTNRAMREAAIRGKKKKIQNFPGGPEVKYPPVSAGSYPWSGKIPPASGQLSSGTTTAEPSHPGAHALQLEKPAHSKPEHRNWRAAPARHQGRKPACSNEDPAQPKSKCINKTFRKEKKEDTELLHHHKASSCCPIHDLPPNLW